MAAERTIPYPDRVVVIALVAATLIVAWLMEIPLLALLLRFLDRLWFKLSALAWDLYFAVAGAF